MMMTNHMLHDNSHQQQQQIQSPQSIADYLAQLLKDRKQLAALPNVFTHLERLLDEGESNSGK
jgi:Homodimerisation region of STAR domain protein